MVNRTKLGQFAPKSDEPRKVRSIRTTDSTWDIFGELAESRGITRADLLEDWVKSNHVIQEQNNHVLHDEDSRVLHGISSGTLAILQEAMTMSARSGRKIQDKIREALELL